MICPKCNTKQIGGNFCIKCGTKLEQIKNVHSSKIDRSSLTNKKISEKDIRNFKIDKQNIPPPPEYVQRKFLEKQKYRLKGIGLLFFWIKNFLFRGIES
ncbi:hypothetical protein J7L67_09885, partial [bacterium]|nr:hypothetical protein [bacterium]